MFKGKSDLDGERVETIMQIEDFEAFEIYSESFDEHYKEGSVIFEEADILTKTDRKIFKKIKRIDYV